MTDDKYISQFPDGAAIEAAINAAKSHAANHHNGGIDAIKLDDFATPDDNTDLNASTTRHGLCPKLPGGTTTFLRGDGAFELAVDILARTQLSNQFKNIITVAKSGGVGTANYICSEYTTDYECIQAAIDYAISKGCVEVLLQDGHYDCPATVAYSASHVHVSGEGPQTVLDFSTNSAEECFYVQGAFTETSSVLTANATRGAHTITVANGALFSAGDWIRIRSEAVFLPRSHDTDYWSQPVGEIQQILSVADNVLTLYDGIFGTYNTSDTATADKMSMISDISFRDLKIIGTPTVDAWGMRLRHIVGLDITNVSFEDVHRVAMHVENTIGGTISDNVVRGSNMPLRGYGVAVVDCSRDISIINNKFYDCRHGVTLTGNRTYGIQYNVNILGNTHTTDSENNVALGLHPTYDGCTIIGNNTFGAGLCFPNGKNTTILGNTVYSTDSSGAFGIYVPSAAYGVIIQGNVIETVKPGIVIDSEYGDIKINNNFITSSGSDYGIQMRRHVDNIEITHNTIRSVGSCIYMSDTDGWEDHNYLKIKDNHLECSGENVVMDIVPSGYAINYLEIDGNTVISTAGRSGIRVKNTSDVNSKICIDNNKCHGSTAGYGIIVSGSSGVTVTDNKLYGAATGVLIDTGTAAYKVVNNFFSGCTANITDNVNAVDRVITPNY